MEKQDPQKRQIEDLSGAGSAAGNLLEEMSRRATKATATSFAFVAALLVVVAWAVAGLLFGFSNTWLLVINTGTTIVTFLMVFLIQRAQNKDSMAIHLKLNEIVAALDGASNRLIDAQDFNEGEIHALRERYRKLIELAEEDADLGSTHSVEEAVSRHGAKHPR